MTLTIKHIQQTVADYYRIDMEAMTHHKRKRAWAWPRQVAMYLCRERTDASLPEIGRRFGGRDHTTVGYAVQAVHARQQRSEQLRQEIADLHVRLDGPVFRSSRSWPVFQSRRNPVDSGAGLA